MDKKRWMKKHITKGDGIKFLHMNKWINTTAIINIMEWSQTIRFRIALISAAAFAANGNLFHCKQMCIAVQNVAKNISGSLNLSVGWGWRM